MNKDILIFCEWSEIFKMQVYAFFQVSNWADRVRHTHLALFVCHRMVEQTSIHEVLKIFGYRYRVAPDVCRIIHVRKGGPQGEKAELTTDKRLWDFSEKMIPNVDKRLKRAGLLGWMEVSWWTDDWDDRAGTNVDQGTFKLMNMQVK